MFAQKRLSTNKGASYIPASSARTSCSDLIGVLFEFLGTAQSEQARPSGRPHCLMVNGGHDRRHTPSAIDRF
jgi:hypothetical protein